MRTRKLLSPAQAREFCRSEEAKMRRKEEANRIDPHYAHLLRQITRMVGKHKVLEFLRKL